MTFNLDIAIFLSFLVITLFIGLGYGKEIKTIKEYALGGRNFSTTALVSTIVGTWASGSGFFITLSRTYFDGVSFIITYLGMITSLLLTAYIFIPRVGEFLGSLSVADIMGKLYGKNVRIITAITGIIGSMGFVSMQFKVFGNLFYHLFGMNGNLAIIIAGGIVILYSSSGGIKAVTFTDILQFFTFSFVIPFIGVVIWNKMYISDSNIEITAILQDSKFNIKEIFNTDVVSILNIIFLIIYFTIPSTVPSLFQRVLIGRDISQLKKAYIISAILFLCVLLSISWISFLVYSNNTNIKNGELFNYIVNEYTFTGIKGLIFVGITAMAMSTADSVLNTSAVLFSNDFCKPLNIVGSVKELLISKIFSVIVGSMAIILALSELDLLSIIMEANSYYLPIVTAPFLLAILGFRTSTKSVLIGMAAGFITVASWKFLNVQVHKIVPAMFMNFIFLMGSHYLLKQPGGWVGIKDRSYLDNIKAERRKNLRLFYKKFQEFNLIKYLEKNAPNNQFTYMGLGIYFIIYTLIVIYNTHENLLIDKRISYIYQIMMVTGTMLALYPLWPFSIKKEIRVRVGKIWWYLAIFYMLIFFSGFLVLLSSDNKLQIVVFAINIVLTIVLLNWKIATVFISIGVYSSFYFYKYYCNLDYIDSSINSPQFIFMYTLLLIGTATVVFLKPKQEELKKAENTVSYLDKEVTNLNHKIIHYSETVSLQQKEIARLSKVAETILSNVNHNLRLPIGNVINFAEMLKSGLKKYSKDRLKILIEEVYNNSNQVSTMIMNMLDLAMLEVKKIQLKKSTINFSEMVINRIDVCKNIYLGNKDLIFELYIQPEILILVDPNYMRQTIDNLVINSIKYSETGVINVKLRKRKDHIEFSISDEGIGIPETDLVTIFEAFIVSSKTEAPAGNRGIGLSICKSAVVAHKGEIKATSNGVVGASFSFKLPIVTNT